MHGPKIDFIVQLEAPEILNWMLGQQYSLKDLRMKVMEPKTNDIIALTTHQSCVGKG